MSNIAIVTHVVMNTRTVNQENSKPTPAGGQEKQKYGSMVSIDMTGTVNFFLWTKIRNPPNRGI